MPSALAQPDVVALHIVPVLKAASPLVTRCRGCQLGVASKACVSAGVSRPAQLGVTAASAPPRPRLCRQSPARSFPNECGSSCRPAPRSIRVNAKAGIICELLLGFAPNERRATIGQLVVAPPKSIGTKHPTLSRIRCLFPHMIANRRTLQSIRSARESLPCCA